MGGIEATGRDNVLTRAENALAMRGSPRNQVAEINQVGTSTELGFPSASAGSLKTKVSGEFYSAIMKGDRNFAEISSILDKFDSQIEADPVGLREAFGLLLASRFEARFHQKAQGILYSPDLSYGQRLVSLNDLAKSSPFAERYRNHTEITKDTDDSHQRYYQRGNAFTGLIDIPVDKESMPLYNLAASSNWKAFDRYLDTLQKLAVKLEADSSIEDGDAKAAIYHLLLNPSMNKYGVLQKASPFERVMWSNAPVKIVLKYFDILKQFDLVTQWNDASSSDKTEKYSHKSFNASPLQTIALLMIGGPGSCDPSYVNELLPQILDKLTSLEEVLQLIEALPDSEEHKTVAASLQRNVEQGVFARDKAQWLNMIYDKLEELLKRTGTAKLTTAATNKLEMLSRE